MTNFILIKEVNVVKGQKEKEVSPPMRNLPSPSP